MTFTTPWRLAVFMAALLLAGAPERSLALEEPEYTVLQQSEDWELRRYAPYIVAETRVEGNLRQTGNRAFRILAGYIFGDNEPGQKMAMTAPVISEPDGENASVYQFVMESAYDMDSLPVPTDSRVELRELPERLVAALSFSGTWNEERIDDLTRTFLELLEREGFKVNSNPMLARYNPPLTPWFLRRNEILVEVSPRS
ncbi:MAG: heme-binding protein [Xanthomonadales bacterium]|jgi:hypothetical protein|nr:heme-binding protein [Xanthomonadales bacterium]